MGFTLIGILSSAAGIALSPFYLQRINSLASSTFDRGLGAASSATGSVYFSGFTNTGTQDGYLAKFDSVGIAEWERLLAGTTTSLKDVARDSSDNVYAAGFVGGGVQGYLSKHNSTGTLQWQRTFGAVETYGLAVESAGNAYISLNNSGQLVLAKYNTSGVIQWQRGYDPGGSLIEWENVALDSSNNIYAAGGNSTRALLVKYDSTGTFVWEKELQGSFNRFEGIAVDSVGSVIVAGRTNAGGLGSLDILIAKYNAGGTLLWQRILGTGAEENANSVAIDSSDNAYVVGFVRVAGVPSLFIAKYDTSGNLVWQRTLSTNVEIAGASIAVTSDGNLALAGSISGTTTSLDILTAYLPSDGSATGVFTLGGRTVQYQVSSLTTGTPTFVDATPSGIKTTTTVTDAAASLTSTATTTLKELVNI
jgi:hypothetical protein